MAHSETSVYKRKVKLLSKKYIHLQNSISALSDIHWKPSVKNKFQALEFKSFPEVTKEDFGDPTYDYAKKHKQLTDFVEEVEYHLSSGDPVGRMLIRNTKAWILGLELSEAKNTPEFYEISKKIYGSSEDRIFGMKLIDIAKKLDKWFTELEIKQPVLEKTVTSSEMVTELKTRLKSYFKKDIAVHEKEHMSSDADAGLDSINIRKGAVFTLKDVGVFEVHEGWVHMGSFMNGHQQPYTEFLGEPCPGTDIVQEGLGALTEVVTMNIYPARAKKIIDRVIAINMAENGASFLDVYRWYLNKTKDDPDTAFVNTERVFHGGLIQGGAPFTRDIIYLKGFLFIVKFLDMCFDKNHPELIPYLFDGNLYIDDIPSIYLLAKQGIVKPPTYVPTIFREDINHLKKFLEKFSFIKDKLRS
jgi:uncharacterized protein (TIGR02421 family)